MAVIRTPLPHASFTMLRNCWLRDGRTTLKAKGLLGYLSSHAVGYKISQAQIVRENEDGREAVRTGLEELERNGYLRRVRQRDSGRFAEDDYELCDPFDADGKLLPRDEPDSGLFPEELVRKSDRVGKTDAGKPTREIAPVEEQGEETTPAPTEQGATRLRAVEDEEQNLRAKLAQQIATEHYEAAGKLGGSRAFLAARQIVLGALTAGHAEPAVRAALAHLRGRGRPLSNSTLGPLLADPRTMNGNGRSPGPYRNPDPRTDPDAFRGAF